MTPKDGCPPRADQLVVCVHATPRAVEPAEKLLNSAGVIAVRHLVQERLLECAEDREIASGLFQTVLEEAASHRPAAILTTCSMYTRCLDDARQRISVPIVGIDEPMIDQAARIGGRLAFVGSIPTSIRLTVDEVLRRARLRGIQAVEAETLLVSKDACDNEAGRQDLADELRRLRSRVDLVVVVQLSLSPAAGHLNDEENLAVLTPVPLAAARLREILQRSAA